MADDFISLTCPSCGGKLQAAPGSKRVVCQYCGVEHVIQRNDGAAVLAPVAAASNRIADELKIQRLWDEISTLQARKAAIYDGDLSPVWAVISGLAAFGGLAGACVVNFDITGVIIAVICWLWFVGMAKRYRAKRGELAEMANPINEAIEKRKVEVERLRGAIPNNSLDSSIRIGADSG